jgi:serine/threonine protein kinase
MGRLLSSSISHSARTLYHLRYRVAVVFFILALFQQQNLYLTSRQALSEKYSATDFDSHNGGLQTRSWTPDDGHTVFQDELIANRASWKVLGEGWEGKVFTYEDSVIKTFTPGRSPFRNCAPDATKWPTEIPASLQFGGTATDDANTTHDGFLPVKAHFMASTTPGEPAEWHLVTPLLKSGNLASLARKLSMEEQPMSYEQIDARYRPAFNELLKNMGTLHGAGYCHDDVKPGNVFIQDESHWVIGDLGNVREVEHPYHSSRIWKDNGQLDDCRANDVVRALQSYLKFIQSSAVDEEDFNETLYGGQAPLSRLFWWTLADAPDMSAEELGQRSLVEYPEVTHEIEVDDRYLKPTLPHTFLSLFSRRRAMKNAADQALTTRIGETRARMWGMVWLFGVPESEIC